MDSNVIGVDMGGTKILSAVVNASGNILATAKIPTQAKDDTAIVIDRISDCIKEAFQKSDVAADTIRAIGIGGTRSA